jgi:homospermidine synthase
VGFGNLGQGIISLLKTEFPTTKILAIDKEIDEIRKKIAIDNNIEVMHVEISFENYQQILSPLIDEHTFLLNLAVEVCSIDLIRLTQKYGALYLDTGIEPWGYEQSEAKIELTNYELRDQVYRSFDRDVGRTALVAHGANPGFISCLVKVAIEKMANEFIPNTTTPLNKSEWASLSKELGIKVIQISECDTQVSNTPIDKSDFINTWSVDGLINEAMQPSELGWGTHEKTLPIDGREHNYGCNAAIYLDKIGANVQVKSWSPNQLDFVGYVITHNESISIADYLTYKADNELYRPTVYFAYRPCEGTLNSMHFLQNGEVNQIKKKTVIKDEVISGIDELGVFLISDKFPSMWFGSNLSISKARKMAPYNNATSLQVVASVVGAMLWLIDNPNLGVIESENLDHKHIYNYAYKYWSPMVSEFIQWYPSERSVEYQWNSFLANNPI